MSPPGRTRPTSGSGPTEPSSSASCRPTPRSGWRIEKDHLYDKGRYIKDIWDYSIDFTGPSDVMRLDAQVARETGHDLFVKTETGIGLEVFQFPYVPAMQRLADKWQHVRDLRRRRAAIVAVLRHVRLARRGTWPVGGLRARHCAATQFLRRMAARDFGPEAADAVGRRVAAA